MSYTISRIRIRDFRGIQSYDHKVDPKGAIVAGGNHRGKTSIVKAIWAALEGQDIRGDAVRIGADESEILIDLNDQIVVKRRIQREGGSSLSIVNRDGDRKAKPQEWLSRMVGSVLDPLDFYLRKDRERLALVLDAMPAKITREEVIAKLDEDLRDLVPLELPSHGIEACGVVESVIYDRRAGVNRDLKAATSEAESFARGAEEVRSRVVLPPGLTLDMIPTFDEAARNESRAASVLHTIEAKARDVAENRARVAKHREEIARIESEVDALEHAARTFTDDDAEQLKEAREDEEQCSKAVNAAELALRAARERFNSATDRVVALEAKERESTARRTQADDLRARVASISAVLADIATDEPEGLDDAKRAHGAAVALRVAASSLQSVREHEQRAKEAAERAKKIEERAAKMTTAIEAFRTTVPAELLAKSNGIPGLEVRAGAIYLDGKSIDGLSQQEQMSFAVDLAKRLNRGSKILVVDGLERIDADEIAAFYKLATADGWQLIGTRVERGELVTEAIEVTP